MKIRWISAAVAGITMLTGCGSDVSSGDVAHTGVMVFSQAGASLPETMTGGAQLVHPSDLAVDEDGVWIADTGNDRVVHLSHDLEPIGEIGRSGSGPGELKAPLFVATTPDEVLVGELVNARISRFRKGGRFVEAIRYPDQVSSLTASPGGEILLPQSSSRQQALRWSAGAWHPLPSLPVETDPDERRGLAYQVALTGNGSVWVLDASTGRVWRWGRPGATPVAGRLPPALLGRLEARRTAKLAGLSRAGHAVIDAPLTKGLSAAGPDAVLIHLPLSDPIAVVAEASEGSFRFLPVTVSADALDRERLYAATAVRLWQNKLYVLGAEGVSTVEQP